MMLKKIILLLIALSAACLYSQVMDNHYIQPDDYFISDRPLEGHSWIGIQVAKMIEPPGANTNGEAKFMRVHDGKELWTKNYWQSRIAAENEIKIGTVAIMFDYSSGDVYIPPKQRDDARTHNWFMAKITDTSTLYKGHVLVSGGYNVRKDNIRVIGAAAELPVKIAETVKSAPAEPVKKETSVVKREPVKAAADPNLKIVKAVYGDFLEDNSMDVTDILNAKVKDGYLKVTCSDTFLGVNFPTANEKSLQIKYQTKDGVFETVVIQSMSAKLPDKNHRKVKQ
jgi:hypothetical protein